VITKELCNAIQKDWNGKVYQKWEKEWKRFAHLNSVVPVFKGKKVLEIGCNGGIESLEICNHCASYSGIEPNPDYFVQVKKTMKRAKCKNVNLLNVRLMDLDVSATDFDTVFTSFVMYHFKDKEVEKFKSEILPKANLWIIYNRAENRETKNNSYVFENYKNTVQFVKDCGFKMKLEWQKQKIWYYIKAYRD